MRYAAVAKGTPAASFVPRNDGTITGCDLVADLDDGPAISEPVGCAPRSETGDHRAWSTIACDCS